MTIQIRIITLLTLFLSIQSTAQSKQTYQSKIDSMILQTQPRPFNGVILITKKDKIIYKKAHGFSDLETKTPLKFDDRFEIMSNTKQMTSVLVLKEVEKGKIDLHSSIRKYLPNLSQAWADSVTVHQLLNHTHGIIDVEKPLLFRPGTDFKYGNLSNILLGKIIEKVTHKTYREVATALFKSLGMKNTSLYVENNNPKLVKGYMNDNNQFSTPKQPMITEENAPADGVVTTIADLAIWNNKLHKGKILSKKMYDLMTKNTVLSQHDVFGKEKQGYGYNIRVASEYNVNYFGHTGLGDGFASMNIYIPKSDISIIVLENQMNENPDLYYYYETIIKNIIIKSELVR